MTHRVFDGDRCALRDSEQSELLELRGIGDTLEIGHLRLERQIGLDAIGKAGAADVVSIQAMVGRQQVEPVPPDRTLPVELEMVEPVRRLEQRWTFARDRIGE